MTTIPLEMRYDDTPLLWTVEDVYSPDECAAFIDQIEASAPSLATNNAMYRNQDRVILDDPTAAQALFARLKPHLPEEIGPFHMVGLNERLRLYRYQQGQTFKPHMDHWYRPSPEQITLLTVLVYFNDGFHGGETAFMEQLKEIVVPKPGLVAIFQHKIRHEGRLVTRGTKYAMRTDVIYEGKGPIGHVELW